MTAAERKAILRTEYNSALSEARATAALFVSFVEEDGPEPSDLAEAADELYLKVGRVAGFAHLLALEDALPPKGKRARALAGIPDDEPVRVAK